LIKRKLIKWAALAAAALLFFALIISSIIAGALSSDGSGTSSGGTVTAVNLDYDTAHWFPILQKHAQAWTAGMTSPAGNYTKCKYNLSDYIEWMKADMAVEGVPSPSNAFTYTEGGWGAGRESTEDGLMDAFCEQFEYILDLAKVAGPTDVTNMQNGMMTMNYGGAYILGGSFAHGKWPGTRSAWTKQSEDSYASLSQSGCRWYVITHPSTIKLSWQEYYVTRIMHYIQVGAEATGGQTITVIPNYEQWKEPWCNIRIGNDTMHRSGCLVCSIADALSYKYHSSAYNPKYVAEHSEFTSGGAEIGWMEQFGFHELNGMSGAYNALKAGKAVICFQSYECDKMSH
jgi:hypothetical protein